MRLKTKLLSIALLLGPIGSAHAIDRVWNGQLATNGWADAFILTNWFNPNNALDNGIPDADDVAIFDSSFTQSLLVNVDSGRTVQSVEFVGHGFVLVGSPLTLTTGDITTRDGSDDDGFTDNAIRAIAYTDNGIWDIGSDFQVITVSGTGLVKRGDRELAIGISASSAAAPPSTLGELLIQEGIVVVQNTQLTVDKLSGSGHVSLQSNATLVLSNSQDTDYSGVLQDAGAGTNTFVKQGNGDLTLSGNNSFGGVFLFDEGKIVATNNNSLGSAQVLETGNTSTLEYQNDVTLSNQIDTSAIRLQVPSGNATHSGLIMGSGSVTKTGIGTLALTGGNFYAGGTTVSEGTLRVSTSSLPASGGVVNNADLGFDQASDGTYTGAISGSGRVIKNLGGTLTLTASNSYTGGTIINAGSLRVNNSSLPAATGVGIGSGAELEFLQLSNGTYSGNVGGAGGVTKTGAGTLTLTGANAYGGGTTISEGTLRADTASLPEAGGVLVDVGATLQFDQANDAAYAGVVTGNGRLLKTSVGTLELTASNSYTGGTRIASGQLRVNTGSLPSSGGVVADANLEFNQSSDGTFTGDITGTGALFKTGVGRLTLTGSNTYGAFTSIVEGTLQVAANNLPPGGFVANNAELEFAQATTGLFSGTIGGGSGGLVTKSGAGQLTLTGDNTYEGTTRVEEGALLVAATTGSATGFGEVTVTGGSGFGGSGLSGGKTLVESGTLRPNFLPGQLVLGELELQSGASLLFEVGTAVASDLMVNGTAELGGFLAVELMPGSLPDVSDEFTLMMAGNLIGVFDNVANGGRIDTLGVRGSFEVNYDGTTDSVVLSNFAELPGDYNGDSIVNLADYTVWRDYLGSAAGTLVNDIDGGTIGIAQYNTWRNNFGADNISLGLTAPSAAVPEPNTACFLLASILAGSFTLRRW